MVWFTEFHRELKQSAILRWGLLIVCIVTVVSLGSYFWWGGDYFNMFAEIRNLITFCMIGWTVVRKWHRNEKVTLTLTQGKFAASPQTIVVKRKQLGNISDLTNLVSAIYYGGAKIEDSVRIELFVYQGLITREQMERINGLKGEKED